MSTANWGICPKCKVNADKKQLKNENAVFESYGNVPADEYEKLRAIARAGISLDTSLREDYEQHITEDGDYYIRYHAHCENCGFDFRFKHNERVVN